MSLPTELEPIESRAALADLIEQLQQNLINAPEEWENQNLGDYLEALSAWLRDMDGYYKNRNLPVPTEASWQLLGEALRAAKYYE